ncbi:MAG: hypothetical protein GY826_30345, partial [Fuerstiella sp.]|nr:hypothetical protein [Fuerstiella sp.]
MTSITVAARLTFGVSNHDQRDLSFLTAATRHKIQHVRALWTLWRETKQKKYYHRWKQEARSRDKAIDEERYQWQRQLIPNGGIRDAGDWKGVQRVLQDGQLTTQITALRHPATAKLVHDDNGMATIANDYFNTITDNREWVKASS